MDRRGGAILGIVLILVGIWFLLERALDIDIGRYGWPLFVIVPGLLLFGAGVAADGKEGAGMATAGGITTVVGLVLAVQNATDLYATWAYAWALVGPGGSGLGLLGFGLLRDDPGARREGLRMVLVGIGLFLAFGFFFEGIIGLSGPPLIGLDLAPLALIVGGIVVIAMSFLKGRFDAPAPPDPPTADG